MTRGFLQIATVFFLVAAAGLWLGLSSASADEPTPPAGYTEVEWQIFEQELLRRYARGQPVGVQSAGIVAAAAVSVTGKLSDQLGNSISGATVYASKTSGSGGSTCPPGSGMQTATPTATATPMGGGSSTFFQTETDGSGNYAFSLDQGTWFIYANPPTTDYLFGQAYFRNVTVGSSPVSGVNLLVIQGTGILVGTVRGSNGSPLSDGFVTLAGNANFTGTVQHVSTSGDIASTGRFTIPVVAGLFTATASVFPRTTDLPTGEMNISLSGTGTTTHDLSLVAPTGFISGTVETQAGVVLTETFIFGSQVNQSGNIFTRSDTQSNADGTFGVPIVNGSWQLFASARGSYIAPTNLIVAGPSTGNVIRVLSESNCIQGRVLTPDGAPTDQAFILGQHRPAGQAYYYQTGAAPRPSGDYSLGVGTGIWDISAVHLGDSGYRSSITRTLSVPPDHTGIDLQLQGSAVPSATAIPGGSTATPTVTPTPTVTRTPTVTSTPGAGQMAFLPFITRGAQAGW